MNTSWTKGHNAVSRWFWCKLWTLPEPITMSDALNYTSLGWYTGLELQHKTAQVQWDDIRFDIRLFLSNLCRVYSHKSTLWICPWKTRTTNTHWKRRDGSCNQKQHIRGQNPMNEPAGSSRAALCHILLLCNNMISLWICNLKHWAHPLTCWLLGKVFMAYSSWVTVELSRLTGISSARSWVVRLNTHAVATRWTCREVGWLCIPLSTSYRKQEVCLVITRDSG